LRPESITAFGRVQIDLVAGAQAIEGRRTIIDVGNLAGSGLYRHSLDKTISTILNIEDHTSVIKHFYIPRSKPCPVGATGFDNFLASIDDTRVISNHITVPLEVCTGSLPGALIWEIPLLRLNSAGKCDAQQNRHKA
jgi:hypothetical protein